MTLDSKSRIWLSKVFPTNTLNKVRIVENSEATKLSSIAINDKVAAVTLDGYIHFAPGYFRNDLLGCALLAHEITHVHQVRKLGIAVFAWRYTWEWISGIFGGRKQRKTAYLDIKYEREARLVQRNVLVWLARGFPFDGTIVEMREWLNKHPYIGRKFL